MSTFAPNTSNTSTTANTAAATATATAITTTCLPHAQPRWVGPALLCAALTLGGLAQSPALAQSAPNAPVATAPGDGPTLLAAAAAGDTPNCPALRFSMVQRRVLNEADRGDDALRAYVQRTRMIHQLDLAETSNWVDQVRARNADCTVKIVAIAP